VPRPARSLLTGGAALLLALGTLASAGAGAAAPPEPAPRPATAADCESLMHQFDVAWPAHRESARAASAHQSRDLGETDCKQGRYTDGVHQLRRALHDIGVKPVKGVAAPAHH